GVKTNYSYEETTWRLIKLYSTRSNRDRNGKERKSVIQDIVYTYDPVGNITRLKDNTYETVFYNNQKVEPLSDYTYDALYRLIKANGRQHPGINARTYNNNDQEVDFKQSKFIPLSDSNALEHYRESYTYDDAGNLIKTTHTASNSWTRTQEIMPDSNRLKTVSSKNGFTDSLPITYDRSGNQQQLNGNSTVSLTFNCCENLVQARIIERYNQPDDSDYYTYDSGEMRTRKVSERLVNGGAVIQKESKIYLGSYEVKRLQQNETTILERQTLRVMDDETCVAIFHYWEQDDLQREVEQVGTRKLRYQMDNHLSSVGLEVDDDAQIISYEEYFPYGGTAFIAGKSQQEVKLKEYRYSGKERDDATGLYYYGARYYAPWLGRWLKPDPAGTVDGLNLYGFVGGNPVKYVDVGGMSAINNWLSSTPTELEQIPEQNSYSASENENPEQVFQNYSEISQQWDIANEARARTRFETYYWRETRTCWAVADAVVYNYYLSGPNHSASVADIKEDQGKFVQSRASDNPLDFLYKYNLFGEKILRQKYTSSKKFFTDLQQEVQSSQPVLLHLKNHFVVVTGVKLTNDTSGKYYLSVVDAEGGAGRASRKEYQIDDGFASSGKIHGPKGENQVLTVIKTRQKNVGNTPRLITPWTSASSNERIRRITNFNQKAQKIKGANDWKVSTKKGSIGKTLGVPPAKQITFSRANTRDANRQM
ncbi:MAG: RHS repeat-associated core domain-containing protein, partial [Moorea sp. SIO2B7]|nr:RHS repeat-associated core domain-containing protein [Moorena sp. SIO2B7]